MSAVTRNGQLTWLSRSADDIDSARALLKKMTPEGVIDELGLGVMWGAFSNLFYPAVTTLMRQARYLLFIPAIYRHIEETRGALRKDADKLARQLQYELCLALIKGGEKTPIGVESREKIQRPPSAIYWNSLAQLHIASSEMSEANYQDQLAAGTLGMEIVQDEDRAAHPDGESLWDEDLPLPRLFLDGHVVGKTTFALTEREADYLHHRYETLRPHGRECFVGVLVRHGKRHGPAAIDAYDKLWDIKGVSEQSQKDMEQARLLSLFSQGVTLQYHRMLIELRKDEDPGVEEAFQAWWTVARDDLANWNVEAFCQFMASLAAERKSLRDREFLRSWVDQVTRSPSAKKALDDVAARKLVKDREGRARTGKERLRGGHHLKIWRPQRPAADPYLPTYRHVRGCQIAREIAQGYAGVR